MDNEKNNLLNDEELEVVSGGSGELNNNTATRKCPKCNEIESFIVYSCGRAICPKCGTEIII